MALLTDWGLTWMEFGDSWYGAGNGGGHGPKAAQAPREYPIHAALGDTGTLPSCADFMLLTDTDLGAAVINILVRAQP